MKVRKFLFAGALLVIALFSVNSVMAQTTTSNIDQVTVNIMLNPIQAILVNSSQDVVNIVYDGIDDYEDGVSTVLEEHLSVFSAGPFAVSVKVDGDFSDDDNNTIDAGNVTIIPTSSSGVTEGLTLTSVSLTLGDQKIITSTEGGNGLKYDIKYDNTAGKDFTYMPKYTLQSGTQTYSATVTYSITAS